MHITEIQNEVDFGQWLRNNSTPECTKQILDLIANQQPSIDAMRFEAAKAAMKGFLASNTSGNIDINIGKLVTYSTMVADALIAELQKIKS